uniref:Uncharacterized protein n=1 Tax=viral metagenome TaxID=1070528 RepID=A0A6C0B2M3_9ZZZZ
MMRKVKNLILTKNQKMLLLGNLQQWKNLLLAKQM